MTPKEEPFDLVQTLREYSRDKSLRYGLRRWQWRTAWLLEDAAREIEILRSGGVRKTPFFDDGIDFSNFPEDAPLPIIVTSPPYFAQAGQAPEPRQVVEFLSDPGFDAGKTT